MSRRNRRIVLDLQLRAAGLLLLAIGVLIFRHLPAVGRAAAGQDATLGQMASIAIGFLALSIGAALAMVGAGLLDPVEISERWVHRPIDPRISDKIEDNSSS